MLTLIALVAAYLIYRFHHYVEAALGIQHQALPSGRGRERVTLKRAGASAAPGLPWSMEQSSEPREVRLLESGSGSFSESSVTSCS